MVDLAGRVPPHQNGAWPVVVDSDGWPGRVGKPLLDGFALDPSVSGIMSARGSHDCAEAVVVSALGEGACELTDSGQQCLNRPPDRGGDLAVTALQLVVLNQAAQDGLPGRTRSHRRPPHKAMAVGLSSKLLGVEEIGPGPNRRHSTTASRKLPANKSRALLARQRSKRLLVEPHTDAAAPAHPPNLVRVTQLRCVRTPVRTKPRRRRLVDDKQLRRGSKP